MPRPCHSQRTLRLRLRLPPPFFLSTLDLSGHSKPLQLIGNWVCSCSKLWIRPRVFVGYDRVSWPSSDEPHRGIKPHTRRRQPPGARIDFSSIIQDEVWKDVRLGSFLHRSIPPIMRPRTTTQADTDTAPSLPRNQVPEWASAYINYKGLKKLIKAASQASQNGEEVDLAGKQTSRGPCFSLLSVGAEPSRLTMDTRRILLCPGPKPGRCRLLLQQKVLGGLPPPQAAAGPLWPAAGCGRPGCRRDGGADGRAAGAAVPVPQPAVVR